MKGLSFLIFILLQASFSLSFAGSAELCGREAKSCPEYGALVFQERCSLCHGSDGMGEGILPLSLKNYPNTNLLEVKYAKDDAATRNIIINGGGLDNIGAEMPPWGDELTVSQLDSVVKFIAFLKKDMESGLKLLHEQAKNMKASTKLGRSVFKGRCALCHGKYGQGDGKMARIIKNPPPFNLTLSRAPDDYLKMIILKGGEKMARSPRMPPWAGSLTDVEVASVIMYIKTLRK
jgi:cytochrome c oxidase cbb3-type subunit 3